MLFGRDLRLPADLLFSRPPDAPLAPEEYIEKLQARMEEMHHLARERIGMASEKMKTRYDARATGHDFHEGDKVWLWNRKRRKGLSLTLQTKWEGPYTVLKRLNDVVRYRNPHTQNRRNTIKDRILKLAENVTDQQKNDINSAPFISLCLDESIDITKSARLAVFARYCVGNIIKEELIAITSLLTTTKGTDISTAVNNSLAEKEIDLKKLFQ
ncbi:retrovirus-related Pol polyprotein from transposon 412 [Trichonephila clavipes]|nr:retrovirus-related Pol polyprotein from transposon 412 [Trichonephila clavipes]